MTADLADQSLPKDPNDLDISEFVQLKDDLWGATAQMNVMTDETIKANDPNKVVKPSAAEIAK
jgi:hypothetical protein